MIVGQYIHKGGGTAVYSPSFARGGLGAIFTASGLQVLGSPTVTITVEHKNLEDTTWSSLGGFSSPLTSVANLSIDLSPVKEQVRYKFTITATNDWEGVLVLMTAPAWRPYA